MKIFENKIELENFNFIYSKRILKLLQFIKKENEKILILSPLTKMGEVFAYKKDNPFVNLLNKEQADYREKIFNEKYLSDLIENINQLFGFEIVDYQLDYEKLIKSLIAINNRYIDEDKLINIIKQLNNNTHERITIVIAGFKLKEVINFNNIDIVYLIDDLTNNLINFNNLEYLYLDNIKSNKIFLIEDKEKFINWLEMELKTVLDINKLNNYLNGVKNFDSFLIEKSLEKILYLDI